jgi:hypothetical protein
MRHGLNINAGSKTGRHLQKIIELFSGFYTGQENFYV